MKIEIISGSARQFSVTRRVAQHLKNVLDANTDFEIGLIDMHEWNLPSLQQVFKDVDSTPSEFRELSKRMFAADAFILVSPEYNGSYAPALKNLLDHYPKQNRKTFGVCTASTGAMGGMRATQPILLLIPALFGIASPHMLIVPNVDKKFDENGVLLDSSFEPKVNIFIREFLELAQAVKQLKVSG